MFYVSHQELTFSLWTFEIESRHRFLCLGGTAAQGEESNR